MKNAEVEIGGTYACKVSDKLTTVRIDRENPRGGWDATNLTTRKAVRIKNPRRLRGRAGDGAAEGARVAKMASEATMATKANPERNTAQQGAPEAAPQAKERTCYVCNKPIATKSDGQFISPGIYRHKSCDPVDGAKQGKPRRKRGGVLDAATQVLAETGEAMTAGGMMAAILEKGLWTTKGKTPAATLYASILREIQKKGDEARFVKSERGKFALRS